ncbi:isocitrate/isopropylmalate family dehydrogenase, partial [Campylobacter jejuni]|nr:isocitrate/isopropylmalate family dehydrogenase [Campylobacter jejuni]
LKYSFKEEQAAQDIENAISLALAQGKMTKDLNAKSYLNTDEMGDFLEILKENNNG